MAKRDTQNCPSMRKENEEALEGNVITGIGCKKAKDNRTRKVESQSDENARIS